MSKISYDYAASFNCEGDSWGKHGVELGEESANTIDYVSNDLVKLAKRVKRTSYGKHYDVLYDHPLIDTDCSAGGPIVAVVGENLLKSTKKNPENVVCLIFEYNDSINKSIIVK